MFNVIDNNNKLEMQMGKLSKRKCTSGPKMAIFRGKIGEGVGRY